MKTIFDQLIERNVCYTGDACKKNLTLLEYFQKSNNALKHSRGEGRRVEFYKTAFEVEIKSALLVRNIYKTQHIKMYNISQTR